ncbi:MAG: rhomboid family intramembrane serine protease [Ignavibacteriae bacterium]|nr:MAG: rhomboid family intramembrane serine protease [Ignavibacteriota bacterium]
MMLIPYKLETTFTRMPYANAALIVITSLIFFLPEQIFPMADQESLVLRDWEISGLLGNMFLHGGFFHLLGNMLFLWIFGNAICATVGNGAYISIYVFLGIIAGVVHLLVDGRPAIGASGAINGIVGMALVLFPRNKIHVWYLFAIPIVWLFKAGKFATKALWMVVYWLVFDILGSIGSPDGIAHWMHIGGFAGGMIIAICALKFNLLESYHLTLFDMFAGRTEEEELARTLALEQQVALRVPAGTIAPLIEQRNGPQTVPTAPPPRPLPAVPDIQLKRCVGEESTVVLYIVNNGAPMNALNLRVPQGVTAKMSQSKSIRRGETGWIRFSTEGIPIDSIEFIIGYQDTKNAPHKMRFRCKPQSSTLEVVSAA